MNSQNPTSVQDIPTDELPNEVSLKPYPRYRDSGQPFLGEIPAHWNLFRNGRLFSQRNETGFGELPVLEVSLKTGVRVRDMDNLKRKQVMSDREKYKRAAQGDIAYNMMRMWQGAVGVAPVDGLVSPAYVVMRPLPEVDCRYFSYLFRTASYMNEVDAYSRGIVKDRNRLYWQDFKRMSSHVPSIEEQRHITIFLDAVGSKAQRFIRNKRRLIELLKEQKQNVINQAVTRGLDPNVKLKPSGVEWIGDIPERWEVIRLKHCISRIEQGWSPQCDAQPAGENEWGVLKVGCVNGDHLDSSQNKKLPANLNPIVSLSIKTGDILVSRANTRDLLGLAALAKRDFPRIMLCDKLFRFRARDSRAYPEFLVRIIRCLSSRAQIESSTNGASSSMQNIGQGVIWNLWISLPPTSEQSKILAHVNEARKNIDQAITRALREIELMCEYRTRLISDVVTGQVDVRGIEVPEVAEEELLALEEDTAESDDVIDDEGDMDEAD